MRISPEKNLEDLISADISSNFVDILPTEAELQEHAERIRTGMSKIYPVSDEQFANIIRRLREKIVVTLDKGLCLPDPSNGHQSWLPGKRAEFDFFFWERYSRYLKEIKHWNPRVISKLGQVADDILDQCGDPSAAPFHIKGLMIGDVQSGKTANYTALINKAADVGYELVIVLAGIPELLRQQTQKRLDLEFCGRLSNLYLDAKAKVRYNPVGVGKYGNRKSIACFTSEANDFNVQVLKSNGLSLDTVKNTILLVVKKNKTILNNLFAWIKQNNPTNAQGQIDKSLFIIDDEADNASINTKNPDEDPTAINNAIRSLLSLFSKTTYLAVTATPFANIFINHTRTKDILPAGAKNLDVRPIEGVPDLFPSDFIYVLDSPTDYIGAGRIFSDDGDMQRMLVKINTSDVERVFPTHHKKTLHVQMLPDDLYEAARYFILANAVRDSRGDKNAHRSMMVHISRFVKVQAQVTDLLNVWLDQVKSDLRNYAQLLPSQAEEISTLHSLHETWNKFQLNLVSGLSWNNILKNYLYQAVAPIDVRSINGLPGSSSLDYDNHKKDGLRVIAVGGNTLSRGLTLEGLMTTYFYRNTNMYDTLMQMGRWFGYRPNYDDLVKVWLSGEAIDWYGQIYMATQDLKNQIYKMKAAKLTPSDFGLKVRQDPGFLIVTARNKMRNATPISCPISVSGHLLETPRLIASREVLEQNANAVEQYIDRLSIEGRRVSESDFRAHGNYFWEGVSSEFVAGLLRQFTTHPWHMSYNGKALADYISNTQWKNGWDVVLIKKGEGTEFNKLLKCGSDVLKVSQTESRNIKISNDVISVSGTKLRVGAGGCARIGLDEEQLLKAKEQYYAIYEGKQRKPNIPDSAYLIKDRNPILMIHVIEARYENNDKTQFPKFLYGLGVGFPADEQGNKVARYQVNLVELGNWIYSEDESDE